MLDAIDVGVVLEMWVTDSLLLRENSDYIQAIGLSSANSNTLLCHSPTKAVTDCWKYNNNTGRE